MPSTFTFQGFQTATIHASRNQPQRIMVTQGGSDATVTAHPINEVVGGKNTVPIVVGGSTIIGTKSILTANAPSGVTILVEEFYAQGDDVAAPSTHSPPNMTTNQTEI